ncbi:MAG TPA: bifunctional metallophosphatase/5'-nucleotidase [Thermoanaerobaculia bacterium]|nr:bifunctional metallophosphatase/5'-nucleotidase [Thermoanaerobaculia bacterium]
MRHLLLALLLAVPLGAQTVTLLHISDYHSHAEPFYTDEGERGGIARTIGYLKQQKRAGALVFSGGDTVNKGSPAWSDKYGCAEWPWLNGVVDAMAFGNHDADYGFETLVKCRRTTRYPILSANTSGFRPYRVFISRGVRIGVFALAGDDFPQLVKGVPELTFTEPLAAARETVQALRNREKVDVVVMIGHQHAEDDYAMAKAIPGIDLIFGSHAHLKRDLTRIPDTDTWYISPSQYLTYISRVEVTVANGKVTGVQGALIPVDSKLPEDRLTAQRVAKMQQELEKDPQYSALFEPIGKLDAPLSVSDLEHRALETMRTAAKADVSLSTTSSVRGSLPVGTLTMETLRAALPYDNEIVVCTMTTPQLQRVLDFNAARQGTDVESVVAGAIDRSRPDATYRVATTDYLAFVAYKDVFDCEKEKTGLRVRDELRKSLVR